MKRIPRRNILKAAGASAFASHFVANLGRRAEAASPRRFVMFWHANGAPTSGDTSFTSPAANVPRGLTIHKMGHDGTGDHKNGMPFSTTGKIANPPTSISIDQAIAAASGKPALVVTGKAKHQNYRGWCSFNKSGKPVLPVENPRTAFAQVFGIEPGQGSDPGDPMDPIAGDPDQPKVPPPGLRLEHDTDIEAAILNRVMGDVQALRKKLPKSELEKMDEQLHALTTLSNNLEPLVTSTQALTVACEEADQMAASFAEPADGFDFQTRVRLHIDLIVAAFACDKRRVATLMLTPGGHDSMEFSFVGVPGADPHNTIAHKISESGNADKMRKIKLWEMEQLAYLIKRLSETKDGNGQSLLDTTLVFAPTECKDGNHGKSPIPVILGGDRSGVSSSDYGALLASLAKVSGGSF